MLESELQLRTAVFEKIMKMHAALLLPCNDRWSEWRPSDSLVELRRLRAKYNPDAARHLGLSSLDDPTFFFWSIFNTQEEVFPEFMRHSKISLRRIISIRNASAHGGLITKDATQYLDYCSKEMLRILKSKIQATSPLTRQPVSSVAPTSSVEMPSAPDTYQSSQNDLTQILAFYIVCDKSSSMAGDPIDIVNDSLVAMHRTIISDPIVADKCWMGVISFSSQATIELPLSPPHQVTSMPHIHAEGITNYGRAFSLVKSQIDNDLPRLSQSYRPLRPVVFFLTDGSPSDSTTWVNEFQLLVDAGEVYAPTVVVFPVGQVEEKTLKEFTQVPTGITPQILRLDSAVSVTEALSQAIQSITSSVVSTVRNSEAYLSLNDADLVLNSEIIW